MMYYSSNTAQARHILELLDGGIHKFILVLQLNNAVYTEASVACCWAGAVTLLMPPALKQPFCTDSACFRTRGTDGPTDRPTDRPTE